MSLRSSAPRVFGALVAIFILGCGPAGAQSAGALANAKELIGLKGATNMFDPLVPGVIETVKNTFLRTNPSLSKDLNDVAGVLRTEFANKRGEIADTVARLYAQRFTEQELKDALAFYKTPLGRKLIVEEPQVLEASVHRMNEWAERFSEDVLNRMRAEMKKRGHAI
jgi:hypothetical protein